jgi:hypothetical protein
MVSAVKPGPNAMPQPRRSDGAFSISSITNMKVADDMFPYRRNTSRDFASAVGASFRALSMASRTERPPRDGPKIDRLQRPVAESVFAALQSFESRRNMTGQEHLETVSNVPGHQIRRSAATTQ